jgi:OmpA-OmpF porin, OOP family
MSTLCINKLWHILLVGVFSATSIAISSMAQAQGWYGGVSIGQTKDNDSAADLRSIGFSGNVDDKDTGWKVFVGNQFNQNAAIEFGYVDLGEVTGSGTYLGLPASVSAEVKGFNMALIGILPVSNEFAVLGRIGLFRWDADATANVAGFPGSASDTGTDLAFGVGAKYDFGKNVGLRVEWERFDVDEGDVDMLSVGLAFKFQ